MTERTSITLTVNGHAYAISVEPRRTLVDAIREDCGQTGTHIGCEHGVCGACTILLDGRAVRSCLLLAVQAEGCVIITIEGLAGDGPLHPLQQAFCDHHGLQCGFCTPGMLTTLVEFLQDCPNPTDEDIRIAISGNLCRCTGYDSIVAATQSAARILRGEAA